MADPSGLSALIEGMSWHARSVVKWMAGGPIATNPATIKEADYISAQLWRTGITEVIEGRERLTDLGIRAAHLLKEQSDER